MNNAKKSFTAVLLAVGLAVVAGCGNDNGTGPGTGGGGMPNQFNPDVTYGTYTDKRQGKTTTYRTVRIGNLTWMAENLNISGEMYGYPRFCHDDDEKNCEKYGGLYEWWDGLCPTEDGWRLPDTAEWHSLRRAGGGDWMFIGYGNISAAVYEELGYDLIENPYIDGIYVNETGFSAFFSANSMFDGWWTINSNGTIYDKWTQAYVVSMSGNTSFRPISDLYSVRCVKD